MKAYIELLLIAIGYVHCVLYYGTSRKNWETSKYKCEDKGLELARLTSVEDYNQAITKIKRSQTGKTLDVWIGLSSIKNDRQTYRWTNGDVLKWAKWANKEPNSQSTDFCVRLKHVNGVYKFATMKCGDIYPFLCSGGLPEVQSLNDSEVEVRFRSRTILACSYTSKFVVTKVYWKVVKKNSHIEKVANPGQNATVIYTLDNVGQDDIGSYQCFVENMYGMASAIKNNLRLIRDVPIVWTNQTDLEIYESNIAVIFCFFEGYPEITRVTWKQNNNTTTETIETNDGVSNLIVEKTKLEDKGNYTCHVSNSVGSVSSLPVDLNIRTGEPYCRCRCEYKEKLDYWSKNKVDYSQYSREELTKLLKSKIDKIQNELRLDSRNVSTRRNRLISKKDDRESARKLGIVAIVFLSLTLFLMVLIDLTTCRGRNTRATRVSRP